jgi:hypothetical protein
MSLERLRFLVLTLGGVVLTAGGLWLAATPDGLGARFLGAFGALFFGCGT